MIKPQHQPSHLYKALFQETQHIETAIRGANMNNSTNYVKDALNLNMQTNKLDSFKIEITAKLCSKLYEDGLVKYVQVTAKNNN